MKKTYKILKKRNHSIVFNSQTGNIAAFKTRLFEEQENQLEAGNLCLDDSTIFLLQNNFYETESADTFKEKIIDKQDNKVLYFLLLEEKNYNDIEFEINRLMDGCLNLSIAILDIKSTLFSQYAEKVYTLLSTYVKKVNVIIYDSSILILDEWKWLRRSGEILVKYDGNQDIYSLQLDINGWDIVVSLNANQMDFNNISQIIEMFEITGVKYFVDFSIGENYLEQLGSTIHIEKIAPFTKVLHNIPLKTNLSFYKVPSDWCNARTNVTINTSLSKDIGLIEFKKCKNCTRSRCGDCRFNKICNYKCRIGDIPKKCVVAKHISKVLFE